MPQGVGAEDDGKEQAGDDGDPAMLRDRVRPILKDQFDVGAQARIPAVRLFDAIQ